MSEGSEVIERHAVDDAVPAYRAAPADRAPDSVALGYKLTEMGVIPEDWEIRKIGDFSPFVTSGARGWARYYADAGALFLRITNLSRNSIHLDLADIKYVALPFGQQAEGKRTCVQSGDLLISITADIGVIGYVDSSIEKPAYLNQHLALVRFDQEEIHSKYAAYFLASERPQRLFLASMDVGAKAGMNLNTIRKLRLALPFLAEQHAIATALSDADALIESLDRLIAKKRAIKQAAMQQLLTGETRLPGFTGEWETKRLGEIGRFRGGSGFPTVFQGETSGQYPFFKVSDMNIEGNETFMESASNYISDATRKKLGAVVFPAKSIVFAKVGAAVFLERKKILSRPSCLDNNMAGFTLEDPSVNFRFIHYVLLNFSLGALVSTTALPSLKSKVLASIMCRLPSLKEQQAIATALSGMDTEIEALERRLDKARQIKQGMMQQLLTGRTRLV